MSWVEQQVKTKRRGLGNCFCFPGPLILLFLLWCSYSTPNSPISTLQSRQSEHKTALTCSSLWTERVMNLLRWWLGGRCGGRVIRSCLWGWGVVPCSQVHHLAIEIEIMTWVVGIGLRAIRCRATSHKCRVRMIWRR